MACYWSRRVTNAAGVMAAQQLADGVDARAPAIPMVDTLGITAEGEYSPPPKSRKSSPNSTS